VLYPSISPRRARLIVGAFAVAATATWAACDKSPTAPVLVAQADAVVPMNPTVASAIVGTKFSFPGGAGAMDPSLANQNLDLTFGGTASAVTSTAVITSPSGAAVGNFTSAMAFGSCDFTITASTFPAGSKLATGQKLVINPCNMNVRTAGTPANGVAATRSAALLLGSAVSSGQSVTISVNPGGQLTLNGQTIGTVTVTPTTG
jgi:hypothetical protein